MEPRAILLLNAALLLLMCVVLPLITSTIGGWRALSGRFRTARPLPSGASWFVNARFGSTPYLVSMAIAPLDEGLYLARLPLFRLLHPPLLIPWSELRGLGDTSNPRRPVLLRVEAPRVSLVLPARFVEVHDDGRVGPRGRPPHAGLGMALGWGGSALFLSLILALQVLLGLLPPRDPVLTWAETTGGQPFRLSWSSAREDDYSLWMDFALTYDGPAWTIGGKVYPIVNGTGAQGVTLTLNRNSKLSDADQDGGAFLEESSGAGRHSVRGRVRLAGVASTGVADELMFSGKVSGDKNVKLEYLRLEVLDD